MTHVEGGGGGGPIKLCWYAGQSILDKGYRDEESRVSDIQTTRRALRMCGPTCVLCVSSRRQHRHRGPRGERLRGKDYTRRYRDCILEIVETIGVLRVETYRLRIIGIISRIASVCRHIAQGIPPIVDTYTANNHLKEHPQFGYIVYEFFRRCMKALSNFLLSLPLWLGVKGARRRKAKTKITISRWKSAGHFDIVSGRSRLLRALRNASCLSLLRVVENAGNTETP